MSTTPDTNFGGQFAENLQAGESRLKDIREQTAAAEQFVNTYRSYGNDVHAWMQAENITRHELSALLYVTQAKIKKLWDEELSESSGMNIGSMTLNGEQMQPSRLLLHYFRELQIIRDATLPWYQGKHFVLVSHALTSFKRQVNVGFDGLYHGFESTARSTTRFFAKPQKAVGSIGRLISSGFNFVSTSLNGNTATVTQNTRGQAGRLLGGNGSQPRTV